MNSSQQNANQNSLMPPLSGRKRKGSHQEVNGQRIKEKLTENIDVSPLSQTEGNHQSPSSLRKLDTLKFHQFYKQSMNHRNVDEHFSKIASIEDDQEKGDGLHDESDLDAALRKQSLKDTVLMRTVSDIKYGKLSKWREIQEKLRGLDMFSQQIHFTYKNNNSYKTISGAILSLIIIAAFLILSFIAFATLVERSDYYVSQSNEYMNLATDTDTWTFSGQDQEGDSIYQFQFAIAFTSLITGKFIGTDQLSSYLGLSIVEEVRYINYTKLDNGTIAGTRVTENKILKYEKCGSNFKATTEETKLTFIYTNTLFNSTSVNNPILSVLSDKYEYIFMPNFQKTLNLYMQKQTGYFKDSLISTTKTEKSFFSVDRTQEYLQIINDNLTDPSYLKLNFMKDYQVTIFERRFQNIFDWLSYVGGYWNSISAIGIFLFSFMGYNIFVSSVMKRLYYFEDSLVPKKIKIDKKAIPKNTKNLNYKEQKTIEPNQNPYFTSITKIIEALSQKRIARNSYRLIDSILFQIGGLLCKRAIVKSFERHRRYQASAEKLAEELDVISFIRNQRYLKAILQIILSSRERLIIWKLNQLNLKKDVERLGMDDKQRQKSDPFHSYNKDGVVQVSKKYIEQFFTLDEMKDLIQDVQHNKTSNIEESLLQYMGLEPDIEVLRQQAGANMKKTEDIIMIKDQQRQDEKRSSNQSNIKEEEFSENEEQKNEKNNQLKTKEIATLTRLYSVSPTNTVKLEKDQKDPHLGIRLNLKAVEQQQTGNMLTLEDAELISKTNTNRNSARHRRKRKQSNPDSDAGSSRNINTSRKFSYQI